jgi:hypothetical protein
MLKMPSTTESYVWVWVDASYLREQAQRCTRVARDCPHLATSHELEAMGADLMQKAAELDELQQAGRTECCADKATSETKTRQQES